MSEIFAKRLKAERTYKGLTQEALSKMMGLSIGTLSGYERNYREPDFETVTSLSSILGVSVDYLLGLTSVREPLPREAIELGETTRIPVIGVIRAGEPILVAENIVGYETVEKDTVKNGDYFFLRVSGDSMTGARIRDGDLVLVRRQEDVDDGQIAVVLIGSEEATLKKVYRQNGQVILQAENPDYPPRIISRGDLRILGKVVEVKFKLE